VSTSELGQRVRARAVVKSVKAHALKRIICINRSEWRALEEGGGDE